MYVLVGEYKGDYDDFYQRPMEPIACSKSKKKLDEFWETHRAGDLREYIDHHIDKITDLDEAVVEGEEEPKYQLTIDGSAERLERIENMLKEMQETLKEINLQGSG